MKKQIKITLIAALTVLCICLCGCGGKDTGNNTDNGKNPGVTNSGNKGNKDGEITGADWRTWGTIDGTGTLVAEGNETKVCVCLFADRAELYYDEPTQRLYKTIDYAQTLTDEQYKHVTINLTDFNYDDNTDIAIEVATDEGLELRMCYVYDIGDYVYLQSLAYPPIIFDDNGNNIDGADWRTWGIIDEYGTIYADGLEFYVCACLYNDRAEIYYDEPDQRLYRTIEYAQTLTDEQLKNAKIIFSELNGDDNTDITIEVGTENTTELRMSYVYDMQEYVYMKGISY
jgi:hypothetical protein